MPGDGDQNWPEKRGQATLSGALALRHKKGDRLMAYCLTRCIQRATGAPKCNGLPEWSQSRAVIPLAR